MGRVARYKKVKACDLFSKNNRRSLDTVGVWGLEDNGRRPKKRSRTAERLRATKKNRKDDEFDEPPEDGDEFDVKDFRVKKILKQNSDEPEVYSTAATLTAKKCRPSTISVAMPTDEEEKAFNRILKLEEQVTKKKKVVEHEGRMEGESKRAFQRRVAAETRRIIKREKIERLNPEKRQRKKEFLINKKKKKKGRPVNAEGVRDRGYESESVVGSSKVTAEQSATCDSDDVILFGEQAQRPPTFLQLPRGAKKREKERESNRGSGTVSDGQIHAEQKAMVMLRRKAEAHYALIKTKRRQNGDFHL